MCTQYNNPFNFLLFSQIISQSETWKETLEFTVDESFKEKNGIALVEEIRSYPCLWKTSCRSHKEQQKEQFAWHLTEKKLGKEGKLYTHIYIQLIFIFGWMFRFYYQINNLSISRL